MDPCGAGRAKCQIGCIYVRIELPIQANAPGHLARPARHHNPAVLARAIHMPAVDDRYRGKHSKWREQRRPGAFPGQRMAENGGPETEAVGQNLHTGNRLARTSGQKLPRQALRGPSQRILRIVLDASPALIPGRRSRRIQLWFFFYVDRCSRCGSCCCVAIGAASAGCRSSRLAT